jgi:predicted DNA-binding WGR domain protein
LDYQLAFERRRSARRRSSDRLLGRINHRGSDDLQKMPNVRGKDDGARKQRPSLTVAQSAKRKRGYADKQDDKNKKSKAAGEKAKADFVLKMARGGKKQPDNGEDFVANAVANALANMVGAEGYGEGSADAILDGVEEEDNPLTYNWYSISESCMKNVTTTQEIAYNTPVRPN